MIYILKLLKCIDCHLWHANCCIFINYKSFKTDTMKKLTYKQISSLLFSVEFESYELLNNEELIWLLKSDIKEERAISAKLLGEREAKESLPFLFSALQLEKEKSICLILSESLMSLSIANTGKH